MIRYSKLKTAHTKTGGLWYFNRNCPIWSLGEGTVKYWKLKQKNWGEKSIMENYYIIENIAQIL